jgi:hypothetical protein
MAGAPRPPAGRAPAELEPEGELRLQGEALRSRRRTPAARAPSLLEGDLLGGRPGRAARSSARLRSPLLPHRIVYGRKRGFSIPAAAWLRGELEPFARDVLSAETLRRQAFFRPEPVIRLLDRHVAGKEDLSRQLWGLLAFTLWYERHVERPPGPLREARLATAVV